MTEHAAIADYLGELVRSEQQRDENQRRPGVKSVEQRCRRLLAAEREYIAGPSAPLIKRRRRSRNCNEPEPVDARKAEWAPQPSAPTFPPS